MNRQNCVAISAACLGFLGASLNWIPEGARPYLAGTAGLFFIVFGILALVPEKPEASKGVQLVIDIDKILKAGPYHYNELLGHPDARYADSAKLWMKNYDELIKRLDTADFALIRKGCDAREGHLATMTGTDLSNALASAIAMRIFSLRDVQQKYSNR